MHITSLANPIVKEIRGLALAEEPQGERALRRRGAEARRRCGRGAAGRIRHAGPCGTRRRTRRWSRGSPRRRMAGAATCIAVSEAVLAKISRRDNPQTVIGVFEQRLTPADGDPARRRATSGWRSKRCATPAISAPSSALPTRSAPTGVILVGDTVDPFSVEAVRATMGSIFHVPLTRASHAEFETLAARWPGAIVGTHLDGHDRLPQGRLPGTGACSSWAASRRALRRRWPRLAARWSRSRWRARPTRSTSRWRPA